MSRRRKTTLPAFLSHFLHRQLQSRLLYACQSLAKFPRSATRALYGSDGSKTQEERNTRDTKLFIIHDGLRYAAGQGFYDAAGHLVGWATVINHILCSVLATFLRFYRCCGPLRTPIPPD